MDSDQEETRPESSLTIQHYQAQIHGLNTTIQNLNTTVTRLRESRDLHRFNAKTLTATNTELQAKIQALTIKEETVTSAEPLDSDVDEQPIKLEVTKTGTPVPTVLVVGNNKKYPDVPYFYGEKEKWDEWRFHLDSKFRQSAVLFPSEKDKMDYIRDHCKSIAFDVLKARADPLSEDPYNTTKEMISELHSMFGDYDKLAKNDALLHDPAFAMKKKEAFDEFYARFSATIAPLGYSESHKIAALRRLITLKLRSRIAGISSSSFRSVVEHLRKTDQDLRQLEAMHVDVEEIDEQEFKSGPSPYSEQLKDQLKKEGRCFKCLGYGHRPNQTEACMASKALSFEEAKAIVAKEKAVEKAVEKQ